MSIYRAKADYSIISDITNNHFNGSKGDDVEITLFTVYKKSQPQVQIKRLRDNATSQFAYYIFEIIFEKAD